MRASAKATRADHLPAGTDLSGRTYGVLGGGFGLYGYLPALVEGGATQVATLDRYRSTIQRRPDIRAFEDLVVFVKDEAALVAACDVLVIALRPTDQVAVVRRLLSGGWGGQLILEKPVAPDPAEAADLLQCLRKARITFTVGFALSHAGWAGQVRQFLGTDNQRPAQVNIAWRFKAHHYATGRDTWKRTVSQGGGALRFYAIHLIAFLSELGDWDARECVRSIDSGGEEAGCSFTLGCGAWRAQVSCDANYSGPPEFVVAATRSSGDRLSITLPDPFQEPDSSYDARIAGSDPDRRLGHILRLLLSSTAEPGSLDSPNGLSDESHVSLWRRLEERAASGIGE